MNAHIPTLTDAVTLEVLRNKLDGSANEMQQTLLRSSFSPIVKEGLDASSSLFTLEGETLAQAVAIPIHLATMIPVLAKMREVFPLETMAEGDVYILNDPYLGGTHLPDLALVMPIFVDGQPVAFSATMTHHQDMGGISPGSVPTNATEIFQEGLRVPPLKFRDRGVLNDTLVQIIRRNVRIPDIVLGDLNAQLAACTVGQRRIRELADRYGVALLKGMFTELLDRSEEQTRAALALIPPGTYHYVDYNDNDGIDLDKRIRFEVAVTVDADRFHVDFTGTSDQVRGPLNSVPSGTLAAACFAIRAVTDPAIPTNGGCFRPISMTLPEGSILNPHEPAPVNARTATLKRAVGCILGALRTAIPDRVPADNAGVMFATMFGGRRPDGRTFVTGELIAGGSGASLGRDGTDVIETDVTNCMNLPAEAMEMEAPIRVIEVALRKGSGGDGAFRGGLGIRKEYEILSGEVSFTHRGERHFLAPKGFAGGADGQCSHSVILRKDGREEVIPSKLVTTLHAGDRVRIETAGGAGYGAPEARAPEKRAADVMDQKV